MKSRSGCPLKLRRWAAEFITTAVWQPLQTDCWCVRSLHYISLQISLHASDLLHCVWTNRHQNIYRWFIRPVAIICDNYNHRACQIQIACLQKNLWILSDYTNAGKCTFVLFQCLRMLRVSLFIICTMANIFVHYMLHLVKLMPEISY